MRGKRYRAAVQKVAREKSYDLREAVNLVKELASARFDETVELAVRLGVDRKKSDQQVRGTVLLPAGTGRQKKIIVLAKGEKQKEAEAAGADLVGGEELIEKIAGGRVEFDLVVATPDIMGAAGKLGKILGPKGLMPTPRAGTVTFDLTRAVSEFKAGRIEFKVDKLGIMHLAVGKVSFSGEDLARNVSEALAAIQQAKPASVKVNYIRSVTVSSTMGPGVRVNPESVLK